MNPTVVYYIWATLLVLAAATCWVANFFSLPGNWITLGLCALFVWLVPESSDHGMGWWTVALIGLLCLIGEVVEFAAGAAGAARHGASRRAMMLSLLFTIVGSIAGALITVPIPVVGPLLGALAGGAAGAFGGAYLGEAWKGRSTDQTIAVSQGALIGRLLGTLGKLAVGALIAVVVAIDAYF